MDLTMNTTMNTTTTTLMKNATALIAEDSMVWMQGTSSCKPVSIVAAGFPLIIPRYMFEELLHDRGGRFSESGMC